MTITLFTTLIGYMFTCSFTPGPGNILALNTTGQFGFKKSKFMLLGICTGYGVVQLLCTLAFYQLSHSLSFVLVLLKYVGSLYMVWLAYQIYRSHPESTISQKEPSFREGFLLQLVNIKIYFYISTLLAVYFIPHLPSLPMILLAGAFAVFVGSLATLIWAFLGHVLQKMYFQYYKRVNFVLAMFLLYCAGNIFLE